MTPLAISEEPLSLLRITIRRSITVGRAALIYGIGVSLFLTLVLGFTSPNGFSAGMPIFLPIFGTVASMGGLTVFSADRQKGVLEYLMGYGISPRRLFLNILLASLVLATLVLAIAIGASITISLSNRLDTLILFQLLIFYTLPMSYASTAFVAIIGMYWTALSSPRQGLNSPLGVAPLMGVLPSAATLGATVAVGALNGGDASSFIMVTSIAVSLVVAAVLLLLARIGRLLRRERLLSPA